VIAFFLRVSVDGRDHVSKATLRLGGLGLATLAVIAAVAWLSTGPSRPRTVHPQRTTTIACGMHVTRSIVVANDPPPCSGDGLIVDANDITINLNGHQIFSATKTSEGINGGMHTGVTVTNGRITNFNIGVHLNGARNKVTKIYAGGAGSAAIQMNNAHGAIASENHGFQSGNGLVVTGDGVRITGNFLNANTANGLFFDGDRAFVSGNRAYSNLSDGIRVHGETHVVIGNFSDNNNGRGIWVPARIATLTRNRAVHNTGQGIVSAASSTDGGGNFAAFNAAPDCPHLSCY
jgi:hypothetical protein